MLLKYVLLSSPNFPAPCRSPTGVVQASLLVPGNSFKDKGRQIAQSIADMSLCLISLPSKQMQALHPLSSHIAQGSIVHKTGFYHCPK